MSKNVEIKNDDLILYHLLISYQFVIYISYIKATST
jgi:hypothetical protein